MSIGGLIMCYFITLCINKEKVDLLTEKTPRDIKLITSENIYIKRAIPDSYIALNVLRGICSCDLYNPKEKNINERNKLMKKFKRKKWSERKIKRTLENKKKTDFIGIKPEIREIIKFSVRMCNRIFLFVHWYSGNLDIDIEFKYGARISYDKIDFDSFPEDVFLQVVKDENRDVSRTYFKKIR
jgi:hypothetical protein